MKTIVKSLFVLAVIGYSMVLSAAPQLQVQEISPDDKKKLVDEWIKRGEQAIENNKRLMALKNRTHQQECEAVAERAYLAAGIPFKAEIQKDGIDSFVPTPTLLFSSSRQDEVTIQLSYDLLGKTQKNVQTVEPIGNLGRNARVMFGGEHAPKGAFIVRAGDCSYMMEDSKPLTYRILGSGN